MNFKFQIGKLSLNFGAQKALNPAQWLRGDETAAAAAFAAGMANVSMIRGQQAHAGLDYVPQEATYLLQKGEMVLDPGTSDQVRNSALGGGGATTVTVLLDGYELFKAMGRASRDGRLTLSSRAIA